VTKIILGCNQGDYKSFEISYARIGHELKVGIKQCFSSLLLFYIDINLS